MAGQVAVVTGGGRGLGEAIATRFAAAGSNLALIARTQPEIDTVAARCGELGAECLAIAADVSDPVGLENAFGQVLGRYGRIDVLVNAAGTHGTIGIFAETDMASWSRAIEVNLLGTVYTCRLALPTMIAAGRGRIVNISGGGATQARPRFSAYAASKAAVVRFTETLAQELSNHRIAVNAIAPGILNTRLHDDVIEAGANAGAELGTSQALRASGIGATPLDVPAELALFLASDASEGLTGRLIAAVHDPWREWDGRRLASLEGTAWYTLRRLDPYTIAAVQPGPQ